MKKISRVLVDVSVQKFGSISSCVVFILQKEQLTIGSGRVGLRNIGNTVSV